jgi:hypothetical protein
VTATISSLNSTKKINQDEVCIAIPPKVGRESFHGFSSVPSRERQRRLGERGRELASLKIDSGVQSPSKWGMTYFRSSDDVSRRCCILLCAGESSRKFFDFYEKARVLFFWFGEVSHLLWGLIIR